MNQRTKTIIFLIVLLLFFTSIVFMGVCFSEQAQITDFTRKNLAPDKQYWFGTDWLGRDMFLRTIRGLSISILIGIGASVVSAGIALVLGILSALGGKKIDAFITWIIDFIMGVPHIFLLILISVAVGRGIKGVVIGIIFTHWTSLARVIRGEILQLKEMPYILMAGKLGKSSWYIGKTHMVPHVMPQFLAGLILLFPHAILHEASITFLGFGLSNEQPAIGIILSESMKYLVTGKWWLAVFPGGLLVLTVIFFDLAGEGVRKLVSPYGTQQ